MGKGEKQKRGGATDSARAKRQRADPSALEDQEVDIVPPSMSRRIIQQAREQQEELSQEDGAWDDNATVPGLGGDFDDDASEVDGDDRPFVDVEQEDEFTEADEEALKLFFGPSSQHRTIADLIAEKMGQSAQQHRDDHVGEVSIDPKVIECYKGVGRLLKAYRSGKLPKAFKIIPALTNWEEVLYYTEPDGWSPNGVRQGTRLFASNLNPAMAQRFYNLVLLPRLRREIGLHKKLHWSLYQALRKSCYKPAAFYKGIILPLCEAGDCTLREATIIGSVIRHVSLPVLHSSVALLKLAEMRYSGSNSIFMRIIIEKKYALPYRVIDGVVKHFFSFIRDERRLPVLWHRCLLSFVQRYKTDLNAQQLEELKEVMRVQSHDLITPEIRNQLFGNKAVKISKVSMEESVKSALAAPEDDIVME